MDHDSSNEDITLHLHTEFEISDHESEGEHSDEEDIEIDESDSEYEPLEEEVSAKSSVENVSSSAFSQSPFPHLMFFVVVVVVA